MVGSLLLALARLKQGLYDEGASEAEREHAERVPSVRCSSHSSRIARAHDLFFRHTLGGACTGRRFRGKASGSGTLA